MWINPDFFFLAAKNMPAIIATITTNIQVEKTVLVTADQNQFSAKACGGIDRICGALWPSIWVRIIDEIYELQAIKNSPSERAIREDEK